MHGDKKKPIYLLSAHEREVEGHLEDHGECPWCCVHLSDEDLAGARGRATVMGYLECDRKEAG